MTAGESVVAGVSVARSWALEVVVVSDGCVADDLSIAGWVQATASATAQIAARIVASPAVVALCFFICPPSRCGLRISHDCVTQIQSMEV